jgi:8-amino-7-oxononanoate synthase
LSLDANQELDALRREGLLRELHALPEAGGKIVIAGTEVLNFSSNDYLDLAHHPALKAAATEAVVQWGCGAGASRLMSGHLQLHEDLENDLARFMETEAALVFGSGFLTNLGVLTALAGPKDTVFADHLNHASLIDGMRLSGAKWHRFRHKDMAHLESLLKKSVSSHKEADEGRRIIVSDSIFSMDGDVAPLKELESLARAYDALLVVDEAHAIGVMGTRGNGVCRSVPPSGVEPDLIVGTLSKALGGYGGFVACSRSLKELLINRARSFIYSTALPPACLGAGRRAVAMVSESPQLGAALLARARQFHALLLDAGFSMPPFESQILPIMIGDNERAVSFSRALRERGIIATAVRPPTVPKGTARLRLSVTLAHSAADLERATRVLSDCARRERIL